MLLPCDTYFPSRGSGLGWKCCLLEVSCKQKYGAPLGGPGGGDRAAVQSPNLRTISELLPILRFSMLPLQVATAGMISGLSSLIHASWWQIPMLMSRRDRLGGEAGSLEASAGALLREMGGLLEGWSLPETRSASRASLYITDVRCISDYSKTFRCKL